MSWKYRPAFDAGHRAALQSGKNFIFVCPPAAWAVLPLLAELGQSDAPGIDTLVLVPDITDATGLAALLSGTSARAPAHAVTGLARAQRLLATGAVRTLLATPPDAMELVRRAALKADRLRQAVVCWPDQHRAPDNEEALDLLLAEAKGAGRVVVSVDPGRDESFLERHARRAPLAAGGRVPERPGPGLRFVVAEGTRLGGAIRAVLDTLNPESAFVWDPAGAARAHAEGLSVTVAAEIPDRPVDLGVAGDVPSAEALAALRAHAREVVAVVRPAQVAYLARLGEPLTAIPLVTEADRARDAAQRVRARLRERMAQGGLGSDLIVLAPLFDEYDPALVAAAALREGAEAAPRAPTSASDVPTWVIVRLNVGQRERLRPGDVVGPLLHVAGLPKDDVGLVDIRESVTLVYVRAEAAERARRGLDGQVIRGRPVVAKLDRR